jgi:hypothetical protein
MRSVLVAIGLFLICSGIAGVTNPRIIAIPHHAERFGIIRGGGSVEIVSKQGCVIYGALSVCLGFLAIRCAWMRGPDVPRRDRSIAQSILIVRRGLDERYGRLDNCTLPQVERTAKELRVPQRNFPYLFAAFLGRAELDWLRGQMPEVGWDEVEARIERITLELPCADLSGTHFHESWRAGKEQL